MAWPWSTMVGIYKAVFVEGSLGVALNMALFVLTLAFAIAGVKRIEYGLYVLGASLLVLSKQSVAEQQQWARYGLILFPAFNGLARLMGDRAIFTATVAACCFLNVFLLRAFLEWSMVV